jgi:hypothetical protein
MFGGLVVGLIIGVAIGYFVGRQQGEARTPAPVKASIAADAVITKKGRKAGLTPEAFQPADDILVRMQEAWEKGEPVALPDPEPAPPESPPPLTEIEEKAQRVLARLEEVGPGEEDGAMDEEPAPDAAPGDETLSDAVNELTAMGYGDDLRFDDGLLRCRQCGEAHDTHEVEVEHVRRFEGPSDPADEAIILALRCPRCGAGGLLVSPYGPDADPALAEAFTYLASRAGHG